MRPTKEGPAMVFNNVKGFDDAKVCIGMLASRKRVAALLDSTRSTWASEHRSMYSYVRLSIDRCTATYV